MRKELLDTTFIIPIRIDSIERFENLEMVINFLHKNFKTRIMVIEGDYYKNGLVESLLHRKGEYYFVEDKDPIFHRTRYINILLKKVRTPITSVWDADVITQPKQIEEAVNAIRNSSHVSISFPYNGIALDTSKIIRYLYFCERKMNILIKNKDKMKQMYMDSGPCLGGAFFILTEKYLSSGMENESFYGWGLEDKERYLRWSLLGYKIFRSNGELFHFTHPCGINSDFPSVFQKEESISIINWLGNMCMNELKYYIKSMKNGLSINEISFL